MVGFLKKTRLFLLASSLFISSSGWSGETFENMADRIANKFSVPTTTVDKLKNQMNNEDLFLLDARELSEYNTSHIPSARYIGYNDFEIEKATKEIPRKAKLVVYCSVGYRSGKIAEKLKKQGYNVYNLKGGIFDWVNKSKSIVDSKGVKTQNIHGYNKSWSKWLKKGNLVF